MSAIVAVDGASKRYGKVTALNDASFALAPGEAVALVGHNGAGKTTLMKLILGLIGPEDGAVRVFGQDPAGRRGADIRRRIGFLPESVAFHSAMTGREVLAFYARLKRAPGRENADLLDWVGLAEAAGRRVGTYSKGMRQRLALAQALVGSPGLLLLDEPTSGLDPESRAEVYAMIDRLRAGGTTILVSTHALAEIERHVDRVAVLHRGRLIADGDLSSLRRRFPLPVRVELTVRTCTTARVLATLSVPVETVSRTEERLVLAVSHEDKIALLHDLDGMRDILVDIDIQAPSLEALYRHIAAEDGGQ